MPHIRESEIGRCRRCATTAAVALTSRCNRRPGARASWLGVSSPGARPRLTDGVRHTRRWLCVNSVSRSALVDRIRGVCGGVHLPAGRTPERRFFAGACSWSASPTTRSVNNSCRIQHLGPLSIGPPGAEIRGHEARSESGSFQAAVASITRLCAAAPARR